MSKQELPKSNIIWDEFDDELDKSREQAKEIDPMKHLLNKMNDQISGPILFDDEYKDV